MNKESYNLFVRAVEEKHRECISSFNELMKEFSSFNQKGVEKANEDLHKKVQDLKLILAKADYPNWLERIGSGTKYYINNSTINNSSHELLNILTSQKTDLNSHKWNFYSADSDYVYSFEGIYNKYRAENELGELFDKLTNELESIIKSGEIDSMMALKSLEELMQLLKDNKNGSYFSVLASSEFASKFTGNLVWKGLAEVPGVKQFKEAFEETCQEMNIEVGKLKDHVSKEINKRFDLKVNRKRLNKVQSEVLENVMEDASNN